MDLDGVVLGVYRYMALRACENLLNFKEEFMLRFITGDMFELEDADILINTISCKGDNGVGLSKQFRDKYPKNFETYMNSEKEIGKVVVTEENGKKIVNFPTKYEEDGSSDYDYIEKGLKHFYDYLLMHPKDTVVIPPLGCGAGGLNTQKVLNLIMDYLVDNNSGLLKNKIYLINFLEEFK